MVTRAVAGRAQPKLPGFGNNRTRNGRGSATYARRRQAVCEMQGRMSDRLSRPPSRVSTYSIPYTRVSIPYRAAVGKVSTGFSIPYTRRSRAGGPDPTAGPGPPAGTSRVGG